MASLKQIIDLIRVQQEQRGISVGEQCAREWEQMIRKSWPGERVYIAPCDSRKDPARAEAIRQAAARLPTGVVTQRLGVSRQLISYHLKKSKNADG